MDGAIHPGCKSRSPETIVTVVAVVPGWIAIRLAPEMQPYPWKLGDVVRAHRVGHVVTLTFERPHQNDHDPER